MILIITSKHDGHINSVTDHFDIANKASWVRINIEDFAKNINLTIHSDNKSSIIEIKDSKKTFSLNDVTAVWYRKPEPINISHFGLKESIYDYVEAEYTDVVLGLYSLLNDKFWINNPFTTKLSHRKLIQLEAAKQVGFTIPKTILSNNEETVLQFAESINWDLAIKSVGSISVSTQTKESEKIFGLWTRRISKDELLSVKDKIKFMPTMYQEYIRKKYELRITCVDNKIFGCKIYSQENPITSEDMRFDIRSLRHQEFDCSPIRQQLLDYLSYFKINFGCFDIAVNEKDEFVFFECNPNGQWLWIEQLTGMKISAAIADILIGN